LCHAPEVLAKTVRHMATRYKRADRPITLKVFPSRRYGFFVWDAATATDITAEWLRLLESDGAGDAAFCRASGLSQRAVTYIRGGRNHVSLPTLRGTAKALRMSLQLSLAPIDTSAPLLLADAAEEKSYRRAIAALIEQYPGYHTELSEASGVSNEMISRYSRGIVLPGLEVLCPLVAACGYAMSWEFTPDDAL
jgi:transcriptional regulator with XRE-family HTH domain